jgi:hypothetical protein
MSFMIKIREQWFMYSLDNCAAFYECETRITYPEGKDEEQVSLNTIFMKAFGIKGARR